MSHDDPRHGTYAGASEHRKSGTPMCPPCLRAERNQHALALADRLAGRARTVPAIGTVRRIQALQALGWTIADISRHSGIYEKSLRNPCYRGNTVYRSTAEAVAATYEALCMTRPEGPYHHRCRLMAQRRGWPPPLAWDDIETDPEPTDWHYTPASRVDQLRELDAQQVGISEACRRLRRSREALERYCHRHGISDVYDRMARREAGADRWGVYGGAA